MSARAGRIHEAPPLDARARIERAIADPPALAALVRELAPIMLRAIRGLLRDAQEVEDALQESLIDLVRSLPGYRGEGAVEGFARCIAVRNALTQRRRLLTRRARFSSPPAADADRPSGEWGRVPDEHQPSPENATLSARRAQLLGELLATLPEAQSEVLALRIVLGLSLEETAEATGALLNTVRSRVRLAKQALRARIEAEPELAELLEEGG